jgi:phage gpG-like protein
MIRFTSHDTLTPALKRHLATISNAQPVLEAMGLAVVSLASRALTQPALRPQNWSPLKPATIKAKNRDGYGSKPLIRSGTLSQSPRVISATRRTVTVGSDRRVGAHSLAAIHQLGTRDGRIPARPFFPFSRDGQPTQRALKSVNSAARAAITSIVGS